MRGAEVVIGYGLYLDLAADAISPGARVVRSPIGAEAERATAALAEAAAGHRVALVCSGDAGIYGLASLVFELAPAQPGLDPVSDITVVPGVTAALAAAAAVGAPLGHDHVAISLSDLLTPWPVIERRLIAAAQADLVVSLYNPRSAGRDWQLGAARDLLAAHRPPGTPVGIVTNAGRAGQAVHPRLRRLAGLGPGPGRHDDVRGRGSQHHRGRRTAGWSHPGATNEHGRHRRPLYGVRPMPHHLPDQGAVGRARRPLRSSTAAATGAAPAWRSARPTPSPRSPKGPPGDSPHRSRELPDPGGSHRPCPTWARWRAAVVARVIHASADLEYADTMRAPESVVEAAVRAIASGGAVITDVEMTRVGITGVDARCYLREAVADATSTRSAAAVRFAAQRHPEGAVVVIGCAPTALWETLALAAAGHFSPAAVIALPVGFVGAAAAKQAARASGLPVISNVGDKGGSAAAAAACNAIVRLARA